MKESFEEKNQLICKWFWMVGNKINKDQHHASTKNSVLERQLDKSFNKQYDQRDSIYNQRKYVNR